MKKQTRREFIRNMSIGTLGTLALNKISFANGYNPLNVLPASPPSGKWAFGITSDLHTSFDTKYSDSIRIFQSALIERKIQLLLDGGDMINWYTMGSDVADWAKFIEFWQENRSKIAHFTTPGNYCVHGDASGEIDFDKYLAISGFPGQTKEKMDYYFDFGNVRFISINSSQFIYRDGKYIWSNPMSDARVMELQNYLDNLFNSAIGKIDHIVIFQHVSAYSPLQRYKNRVKLEGMYNYLANKYPDKKYFTINWFTGHDHIYYKTLRNNMDFIVIPSGGRNGTYKYVKFLEYYNRSEESKASLDLIDGDIWGEGEQCFIEGEVDGKTIEFRLVAFNSNASNHYNPCYPPEYQNPNSTYPKGAILNSFKKTTNANIIDNVKKTKNFNAISSYPNPFNPECYIDISNQLSSVSKIKIYNILGQVVRELNVNNGTSSVYWDGRDNFGKELSSGMYFYEMLANNKVQNCRKMLMLK